MTTHTQPHPPGTPAWTDLVTPDIDAARNFYHALFGWAYDIGNPEFGGYTTARVGNRSVAGLMGNQPGAPPVPAAWGLYFATDNIEADVERAIGLGAKVLYPTIAVGDFGSMVTCEDPTGGTFSLWQAGQHIGWQVTNEPGATAWHELYTPDAKRAREFYTALLHATADPMPGGLEYYTLKQGDAQLCGIMQIDPAWGNMPAQWVTYFIVTNVDEAVATVLQHGGQQMGSIDDSPFGRLAAVADPSGAIFKLIQPPSN
jgi:uncharacterized protein